MYEIWDNLNQSRMVEAWHDAQHAFPGVATEASLSAALKKNTVRKINTNRIIPAHPPLRLIANLPPHTLFINLSLTATVRISAFPAALTVIFVYKV